MFDKRRRKRQMRLLSAPQLPLYSWGENGIIVETPMIGKETVVKANYLALLS